MDNIQAARRVAREAIVLLKNEGGLLPLKKDLKSIAVIGPLANSRKDPLGPWAGPTDTAFVVTLLKASVGGTFSPGFFCGGLWD